MYYRIANGKLWSVREGRFMAEEPEDAPLLELYDGDSLMDEDGLRRWLASRGEPLGMLRPLEEVRDAKLAEIMAGYEAAFAPIEAAYPAKERETWTIQLEEARAVMADPTAETPLLAVLVAARGKGESVIDFAQAVMGNNAAYRRLAGFLTGRQQRMFAEVKALESAEEIAAYEVAYPLPEDMGYAGM